MVGTFGDGGVVEGDSGSGDFGDRATSIKNVPGGCPFWCGVLQQGPRAFRLLLVFVQLRRFENFMGIRRYIVLRGEMKLCRQPLKV